MLYLDFGNIDRPMSLKGKDFKKDTKIEIGTDFFGCNFSYNGGKCLRGNMK